MKANHTSKLVLFILAICIQITGFSQAPKGISYQAVIRDGNGSPIANKTIGAKITLENALGVDYYVETQSPTSNGQGVISLIIGKGAQVGSNTFTSIPWKNGDVHVMMEIDPAGSNAYVPMGTSTPLQSVPYALYAENVKEVVSQSNATDEEPIFVVRNKEGKIVFAVYQTGVRVYVEDTAVKGTKGGFAVGGLSGQAKGDVEYLRITSDSARIFVNEIPGTKGTKGGFAVGGLSGSSKAISGNYLDLTPENYFIGHQAGKSITTGKFNSFMGYNSGFSNTTGINNVFIGYMSGRSNLTGGKNVFIGDSAGYSNIGKETQNWEGNSNVFIGDNAGKLNTTGYYNVFIGTRSGYKNTVGGNNIFIGYCSGQDNTNGVRNVFVGKSSGQNNTTGDYNTFLGMLSGNFNTTGSSNVFIGDGSGFKNTEGTSNVFVGTNSGQQNTTGTGNIYIGNAAGSAQTTSSNKLFIDNSGTNSPLIYGDFSKDSLVVNGKLRVNGNFSLPIVTVSSNTTLGASHHTVLVNANVTITLPPAYTSAGKVFIIKKITATAGNVIIEGNGSETIDGALNQTISVQWQRIAVQSNGVSWFIIN